MSSKCKFKLLKKYRLNYFKTKFVLKYTSICQGQETQTSDCNVLVGKYKLRCEIIKLGLFRSYNKTNSQTQSVQVMCESYDYLRFRGRYMSMIWWCSELFHKNSSRGWRYWGSPFITVKGNSVIRHNFHSGKCLVCKILLARQNTRVTDQLGEFCLNTLETRAGFTAKTKSIFCQKCHLWQKTRMS